MFSTSTLRHVHTKLFLCCQIIFLHDLWVFTRQNCYLNYKQQDINEIKNNSKKKATKQQSSTKRKYENFTKKKKRNCYKFFFNQNYKTITYQQPAGESKIKREKRKKI